jgi:hypothetical protein
MVPWVAVLAYRRSVWSDFEEGRLDPGDIGRLEDADDAAVGVFGLVIVVGLATAIVLSIWSLRVARRARATAAADVSPGLACGGWYIPFANTIVPFVQLRRVARHRGRGVGHLNTWQGLAIASLVLSLISRGAGDVETAESFDEVSQRLAVEVTVGVLIAVVTLAMAYVATLALRDVDPPAFSTGAAPHGDRPPPLRPRSTRRPRPRPRRTSSAPPTSSAPGSSSTGCARAGLARRGSSRAATHLKLTSVSRITVQRLVGRSHRGTGVDVLAPSRPGHPTGGCPQEYRPLVYETPPVSRRGRHRSRPGDDRRLLPPPSLTRRRSEPAAGSWPRRSRKRTLGRWTEGLVAA